MNSYKSIFLLVSCELNKRVKKKEEQIYKYEQISVLQDVLRPTTNLTLSLKARLVVELFSWIRSDVIWY